MRRFRNPRYAPESLERKLSPSGFSYPVAAEFATVAAVETTPAESTAATAEPPPVPDPTDPKDPNPCPAPGEPPSGDPTNPLGPSEPGSY
jgi:hypothetical protein